MHKEGRRTINVVIVSTKFIDRACSFVLPTTTTLRITTFEDGKSGHRDASRRLDDHRAQRGCEGLRGQGASVCIQVVRFVCRLCSAGRPYPGFILSYRAAELLVSIPHQKLFAVPSGPFDTTTAPFASTPARPRTVPITDMEPNLPPHRHAPKLQRIPEHVRLRELELEMHEGDFLATAQKCFEHREFRRAVYWLHECRSAKASFLSVYSQYMVLYDLVFRSQRLDLTLSRKFLGG